MQDPVDIFWVSSRNQRFALILIYAPITVRRGSGYRGGRAFSSCYRLLCINDEWGFAFLGAVLTVKITRFMSLLEIPVHLACGGYLMVFVRLLCLLLAPYHRCIGLLVLL